MAYFPATTPAFPIEFSFIAVEFNFGCFYYLHW